MSDTQANSIRDLLLAALSNYDATIDLDTGSRAYSELITPIYDALSPDPFDTDLEEYLILALKEQYPTLELQNGDLIIDLLIRPLQILLEPIKREIALLKKRQSTTYVDQLTIQDAEDLAANYFVTRKRGNRARGVVRILLSNPSFISITDQVRFSTREGLLYYPLRQEIISAETIALQRVGNLYYADVTVVAETEGDEYNVDAGTITIAEGIPRYVSISNPFAIEEGTFSETKEELLSRVEQSLTERSLTSKKGIIARLKEEFDNIKEINVTGYGDPEMNRDILTGSGDGFLLASGISFIVGRYMFMLTTYEDANEGNTLPSEGDTVKLNFWKFMYATSSVETNYIEEVIYTSFGDAADMPTVHIFLLKENVQRSPITTSGTGAVPGLYMGVFSSVFTEPSITISGLPLGKEVDGGVLPLTTLSDKVHIGGRYDIWVRPTVIDSTTSSIGILKSQFDPTDIIVYTDGSAPDPALEGRYTLNRIGLGYTLELSTHSLVIREPIIGNVTQTYGFLLKTNGSTATITCRSGSFTVGETITGLSSGQTAVIQSISITEANSDNIHSVITFTEEIDESFVILDTFEDYYIVNKNISDPVENAKSYIHNKTGVQNIFDPTFVVYPLAGTYSSALSTKVGEAEVVFSVNLVEYGVVAGDTLEILSGEDIGRYNISSIESISISTSKAILASSLTRTNTNVKFLIIREETPVVAPLIRTLPNGVIMSAATGEGFNIPYKKPIGAYALGAFSGSIARYKGLNGLVLPNLSSRFEGAGALVGDLLKTADPTFLSTFSNATVDDCITEGCTTCTGIPVTCSVTIDGTATSYSNVKFYISGLINAVGRKYLSGLRTWLKSVIDTWFRGVNSTSLAVADDLDTFVDSFAPIYLGQPDPLDVNENIIKQFEICIPLELFDSCNNTYLAIPEFNWDLEFESVSTFEQAMNSFLAGTMKAKSTALKEAKPGDSLLIESGANKGEYVIDKIVNIPVYNGDTVVTESTIDENGTSVVTTSIVDEKAYDFTLVVIKGEFPHETLKGSSDFFTISGIPTVSNILPNTNPISINTTQTIYTTGNNSGEIINPFTVIEEGFTLLFKTLYTQGFDLPQQFSIKPGPVLSKIIKSFFSGYITGNRSPQQTTRMLFQDPVDITVYSPKVCSSLSWRRETNTPPTITGKDFSLPISSLGNLPVEVAYTTNGSMDAKIFSGVLPLSASSVTSSTELAVMLQEALDPSASSINITVVPVGLVYGITITSLVGGAGSFLEVKADSLSDGFAWLGFQSAAWGPLPEKEISVGTPFRNIPKFYKNFLYVNNAIPALTTNDSDTMQIQIQSAEYCWFRVEQAAVAIDATVPGNTYALEVSFQNIATSVVETVSANVVLIARLSEVSTDYLNVIVRMLAPDINSIQSYITDIGTVWDLHTTTFGSITKQGGFVYDTAFFTQLFTNNNSTINSGNPIELGTNYLNNFKYANDGTVSSPESSVTITGIELIGGETFVNGRQLTIVPSVCMPVEVVFTVVRAGSPPVIEIKNPSGYPAFSIVDNSNHSNVCTSDLISDSLPVLLGGGSTFTPVVNGTMETSTVNITIGTEQIDLFVNLLKSTVDEFSAIFSSPYSTEQLAIFADKLNTLYMTTNKAWFYVASNGRLVLKSAVSGQDMVVSTNQQDINASTKTFNPLSHINQSYTPSLTETPNPHTITLPVQTETSIAQGSSVLGLPIVKHIKPQNGTRFSITQYSEDRQLIVDIQDNEDYFYAVMPRRRSNLEIDRADLFRDAVFTEHYTLAECCRAYFTSEDGESPLQAGVVTGDLLYVHEQVCTLDNTGVVQSQFSIKKDRILHVTHSPAKNEISLLNTVANFLVPESTNSQGESPPEDVVEVGDIVYFEEVNESKIVTRVTATTLTLDSHPALPVKQTALASGYDGVVTGNTFTSQQYTLSSSDVGLYLVVYGSMFNEVDGTYEIETVVSGVATLSETFASSEANLHFLIVKPDFTEVGDSTVNGFSETKGVTPIRIYRGNAAVFSIGLINKHLSRVSSFMEILYGDVDGGPRRGVKQPCKVLRASEYRITANQMNAQGTEGLFYYFDVPTTTLTPSFDLNIPENTQYTPVVNTLQSRGYDLIPLNKEHVFSTRESCQLVIDSAFIPQSLPGAMSDFQSPEKTNITLNYETSNVVSSLQAFTTSDENKNVCSDPLVRHFLPSYFSIQISGSASSDQAAEAVVEYIESLTPTDSIQLSLVEKALQYNGVSIYSHPIFMYCLTHDLNRNIVLTRSDSLVDDSTILHDGTNRITYFIASSDDIVIGGL